MYFVTIVTSLDAPYPINMDKVDYEAKLAEEVEKLRKFQTSLQTEYRTTHSEASDGEPELDPVVVAKAIQQKFLKSALDACDTIVHLVTYSDKDAVRFGVAKYIIDKVTSNPDAKGETLDDLLKQLTANSATPTEE
jgi:hypothetical protein